MNYKSKLMVFLLDVAVKFPFLFSKDFKYLAEEFHSKSQYVTEKNSEKMKYSKVSLFDSDFFWKAISYTCLINSEELVELKKWKEKNSLHYSSHNISKILDTRSFDREGGWANIGLIRVDKENFTDDLNSIYMNSQYIDSVYISLKKYPAGLTALTFYILFKPEVTDLVKLVTPPKITDFVSFGDINIFSRKINSIYLSEEGNHCENFIKENIEKVYNESWALFNIISRSIGIKKNVNDVYCVNDMYLNQTAPYFDRNLSRAENNLLVILPKMRHFSDQKLSENTDESFIIDTYFNIKGIDMTYMKICNESEFDEHNNFMNKYCSNNESHLAVVPLLLLIKNIERLSNEISQLKLHNTKGSMVKLHKKLFSIVHELELIDGWIKYLKKDLPLSLVSGYKNRMDGIMQYQGGRVQELKSIVKTFYSLSENRVQISNLRYNKRYSIVVFGFIIIQVFLAAMTIDWGKVDAWYSPIIIWIKNLY